MAFTTSSPALSSPPMSRPASPETLLPFELDFDVGLNLTIPQMMFVSGETGEPSPETTTLIESIVQDQVQHMLRECTALATRRGSKSISTDDLFMLIRHDRAKISRLRHFLQWKDVRRSVKDSDDKGGDGGADVDPAECGARLLEEPVDLVLVGQVGLERGRPVE